MKHRWSEEEDIDENGVARDRGAVRVPLLAMDGAKDMSKVYTDAEIDKLVADRAWLLDRAQMVLGPTAELAGKTAAEIKAMVVRHVCPDGWNKPLAGDYLAGAFDGVLDRLGIGPCTGSAGDPRQRAYSDHDAWLRDAWQGVKRVDPIAAVARDGFSAADGGDAREKAFAARDAYLTNAWKGEAH